MKYRIIEDSDKTTEYPFSVQRKILGIWIPALGYKYNSAKSAENDLRDFIHKRGRYTHKDELVVKEISTEDVLIERLSV